MGLSEHLCLHPSEPAGEHVSDTPHSETHRQPYHLDDGDHHQVTWGEGGRERKGGCYETWGGGRGEETLLSPVVQRNPPSIEGMKNGGWYRTMLVTRPTSQMPMHRTHWKKRPTKRGKDRERVKEGRG